MKKSTVIKQNLAGPYQQASVRINQNVLIWLVFALGTAVMRGERRCTLRSDHSVSHSGIKFRRAVRRVQAETLVQVQCEKKGPRGEEKGVVPELPAGSQLPELARHVDTEPGPDLKPPELPEGKR